MISSVDMISAKPWNITLVDDDPMVLRVHAEILKMMGHSISVFERPEDALNYVKQHAESIDLMITDYHMPGMNGLDLLDKIRKLGCDLPAMILTGYAAEIDDQWAEQCNAQVVNKPVRMTVLKKQIQFYQQEKSE